MEIQISQSGSAAVATITGEVDGKTAPQAQAELLPVISS